MAGDYSAGPEDDDGFTKVTSKRTSKKVTFPFEEPSACIDVVNDDDSWDDDDKPKSGSITLIQYIDHVIASHAPAHMKDSSVRTKSKHVEDQVSRMKKRLEELRAISDRTRNSNDVGKAEKVEKTSEPEQALSPVVINLVTPETHQARSPEVPSL